FLKGEWFHQLGQANLDEQIFRNAGSITGRILKFESGAMLVMKQDGSTVTIKPQSITYIRSPRAFTFSVDATQTAPTARPDKNQMAAITISGQSRGITFRPTAAKRSFSSESILAPEQRGSQDDFTGDL